MQAFRRVFRNTGILYVRMGLTVFLSLYTTRVTLQALGVADYGIYSVVASAIAMLGFLNTSMAAATQRFMSFTAGQGSEENLRSVFAVSVVIHAAIAVAVCGMLVLAGILLFDSVLNIPADRLESAHMAFAAVVVSTAFSILAVPYDAAINARENMLAFAVLSLVEAVLKFGAALVISAADSDRLILYAVLMTSIAALDFCLKATYCHGHYSECSLRLRRYWNAELASNMTSFAGWSFLGSSTTLVSNYGQSVMVNSFFGPAVNSAQAIASQVNGQLSALAGTILKALNPLITKSEGAGDRELMLKASLLGSKLGFFMLMIFFVPMLLEMPAVLGVWLGQVPEFAVVFCRLLLLRSLIEQMFFSLTASIAAVGDIRRYETTSAILALVPLPLTYALFASGFDPSWMYVVYLVYACVASSVILYFANRLCSCPVRTFLTSVLGRCLGAFAANMALIAPLSHGLPAGADRLTVVCLASVPGFVLTVWVIGLNARERSGTLKLAGGVARHLAGRIRRT
jgi:Na+-driven multidrug efflux pump